MTRKIIILALGYFLIGILTFSSCEGFMKYDATICDIEFAGLYSLGKIDDTDPDVFENQIGFEIIAMANYSHTCYFSPLRVFNSAYATSKCANYKNQLLRSTYQISLNRPVVLNGDTIPANTEILGISEIKALTKIRIEENCDFVSSEILFAPELLDKIEFETGVYDVKFMCSTSDKREFMKTRRVIFKF